MGLIRFVCCFVLVASITACGFHLRDSYNLSPELSALKLQVATPNGELARTLKRSLQSSGVSLVDADTFPQVFVGSVDHKRRVLSVDTAGNPQEYELLASTTVFIPETKSGFLLPSRELQVRRDYIYESTGVLSSSDQEAQLKIDMERELARRIMRVLHSAR